MQLAVLPRKNICIAFNIEFKLKSTKEKTRTKVIKFTVIVLLFRDKF